MIGETRAQLLARIGADRDVEARPMYRALVGIVLDHVLGEDDGQPFTVEQQRAVQAAFEEEIDRIVADAGYGSVDGMEAAR